MSHLTSRLIEKGYTIKFGPSIIDHICNIGYDEKFGARPLKRSIQSEVEDFIAAQILKGGVMEGNTYSMSYNKNTEKFKLVEKQ